MMKNIFYILTIIAVLSTANSVSAQAPTVQWQKSLGGGGNDYGKSVQQTYDGGYIVAGESPSKDGDVTGNHGFIDFWIAKLDSSHTIKWQSSYGGTDPSGIGGNDAAYSLQQTTDGGYIVAGVNCSKTGDVTNNHVDLNFYPSQDYWVIKLDTIGNIKWQKSLGGTGPDIARSVQQTSDGGYIVVGESSSNNGDVSGNHGSSDFWIVKLDTAGTIKWQKTLGGSGSDYGESIQQTADGGYIVAGVSQSNDGDITGHHGNKGVPDYWVVKLDTIGTIQWQKSLGGTGNDYGQSVIQTTDGNYLVAGSSRSIDGDVKAHHGIASFQDIWVVKLDSAGTKLWEKSFGGDKDEEIIKEGVIKQTADGNYIVTGNSWSTNGDVVNNHGNADYWVVKMDTSGGILWQQTYGGSGYELPGSIGLTSDGGYIIAGESESNDGEVSGNHGKADYWVVKLSPESATTNSKETVREQPFLLYPNPAKESVTLGNLSAGSQINIVDITGKMIYYTTTKTSIQSIKTKDFVNGIYIIQVENKGTVTKRKLVVNK